MSKLPSDMDKALFTSTFANIYEHTPSIPETAYSSLQSHHTTAETLRALFSVIFNSLSYEEKRQILNAYPLLAVPKDAITTLTAQSITEQTSQGLSSLSADLRARFQSLNIQYEKKFGWPFILPVKDFSIDQILEHMVSRLRNEPAEEFTISCACVDRIAQIRLENWFSQNHPDVSDTNIPQTESS